MDASPIARLFPSKGLAIMRMLQCQYPQTFGNVGAAVDFLFGIGLCVVGIGILGILLISLVVEILTRKK